MARMIGSLAYTTPSKMTPTSTWSWSATPERFGKAIGDAGEAMNSASVMGRVSFPFLVRVTEEVGAFQMRARVVAFVESCRNRGVHVNQDHCRNPVQTLVLIEDKCETPPVHHQISPSSKPPSHEGG